MTARSPRPSRFRQIIYSTMGLFSLSDIIITITLLVNAIALMSSKVYVEINSPKVDDDTESSSLVLQQKEEGSPAEATTISRFYLFLNSMRKLSGLIVVWNVFFIILMLFVFRS